MSIDDRPAADRGGRATLRALAANRDYRLMWFGSTVSQAGSSVSALAFPLLALAESGSAFIAGLVATVGFAASLVGNLPAGFLADTMSRKGLLVWGGIVHGALVMAVGIMAVGGWYSTPGLLALTAAGAITAAITAPARLHTVRILVDKAQFADAVAINTGRGYVLSLVMPPAGGALFALNRGLPFIADAVTYWVAALCVGRIRTDLGPRRDRVRPPFFPAFAHGWSLLWRDRFLRGTALYSTFSNLLVSAVLYIVLLGAGADGLTAIGAGAAVTVASFAGLLGSSIAPTVQRRRPLHHILVAATAVRAVFAMAAVLVDHQAVRVAVLAAVMFCTPVVATAISTAQLLHISPDVLGQVSSATTMIASCVQPLAPICAGLMVNWFGAAHSCGALAIGFAMLSLAVARARGIRIWSAA